MKKYFTFLFVFFIFYILFFIFIPKTHAVTESDGNLQVTYDKPLFPSTIIWSPGLSLQKSFTVKNLGTAPHKTFIKADNKSQTGDFAHTLYFKITEETTNHYGGNNDKTLKNFWDDGEVNLSDIGAGGSTSYDITITMPKTAGNEYQGKTAKFDLIIGFVGSQSKVSVTTTSSNSPTTTPTAVLTVSPTLIPPGEILGLVTETAGITATPTAIIAQGQIKGEKTSRLPKPVILGLAVFSGAGLLLVYYWLKKP